MEIFDIYWSDYVEKGSYKIGTVSYDDHWRFNYNIEEVFNAIDQGFRPFPDMPDISKTYESATVFPTFGLRYGPHPVDEMISIMKLSDASLVTDKVLIKKLEKGIINGKN